MEKSLVILKKTPLIPPQFYRTTPNNLQFALSWLIHLPDVIGLVRCTLFPLTGPRGLVQYDGKPQQQSLR